MSYINRRQILGAGIISLADLVIGGPLTGEAVAAPRNSILDSHLHIPGDDGRDFQWHQVTKGMPEFVRYLDKCGVRRGIISSARSLIASDPAEFRNGNRETIAYAAKYRGRFIPTCVVSPFKLDEALREVEECRKQHNVVWMGEICNYMSGFKYETPEWTEIMKLATRLNYVIQIHTNAAEMAYLAANFPESTIVFPHFGAGRDEIFKRIDIVAAHKNTLIDVSGSGIERVGILERAVKQIGADRVLYGSDFTINEPSAVLARIQNAFLTKEDREKILFRNTERLLKQAG